MTTELIQLTNQPKPGVLVTAIRDVPNVISGTNRTLGVEPRPSSKNTGRIRRWTLWILFGRDLVVILSVRIATPFPNVAVHVVQPERVGSF